MSRSPCRPTRGSTAVAALLLAVVTATAEPSQAVANPIGRVARAFNDRLVEVESRVDMLRQRVLSLADFRPSPLQSGLGFQGKKLAGDGNEAWVMLDLGKPYRLDRIYLVPVQADATQGGSLFPRRFVVETSDDPTFAVTTVLYRQFESSLPDPGQHPLAISGNGNEARYVRLLVIEGNPSGESETYGLSEFVVLSNTRPISFGAVVTSSGQLKVPALWDEPYLTDGRMPMGPWHSGPMSPNAGLKIPIAGTRRDVPVRIEIDLGQEQTIDRIHLMPLECPSLPGIGVLPDFYEIAIGSREDGADFQVLHTFDNRGPLPHTELCPVTIVPPAGRRARFVELRSNRPWQYGEQSCHGLAEVQVFSGLTNVALGKPVRILQDGNLLAIPGNALVDGFSSKRKIQPIHAWLFQLVERERMEKELATLEPLRTSLSDDSELHASWALSTLVGLAFLVPVAIIERRRLISREQLDVLRKRIASDLHDDIGSNLGSISMIARSAKRDLQQKRSPQELADDLEEVEVIARESSLALRDIVWLIERRADTIGDVVKRLRDTAARLMRELDSRIECTGTITSARLSLDAKRHLFLFCKEAMHNVVKHAHASSCEILITDIQENIVVEIRDNGVGLSIEQLRHRTIFHKIEERARQLGGILQIESAPGEGTTLSLRVARAGLLSKIPL